MDSFLLIVFGIAALMLVLWGLGRLRYGSWIGGSFGAKVLRIVASTEAKSKYAFPYVLTVYALDADSQGQPQVGLVVEGQIPTRSTYRRALKLPAPQAIALAEALRKATVTNDA